MKYIWEESDIIPGRYYYKGETAKSDLVYLATTAHKIGFLAGCCTSKGYVSISICDGMVTDGKTSAELAQTLNENGYIPLRSDRLLDLIAILRKQNEGVNY